MFSGTLLTTLSVAGAFYGLRLLFLQPLKQRYVDKDVVIFLSQIYPGCIFSFLNGVFAFRQQSFQYLFEVVYESWSLIPSQRFIKMAMLSEGSIDRYLTWQTNPINNLSLNKLINLSQSHLMIFGQSEKTASLVDYARHT